MTLASSLLREQGVTLASSLLREQGVTLASSLLREQGVTLASSLLGGGHRRPGGRSPAGRNAHDGTQCVTFSCRSFEVIV